MNLNIYKLPLSEIISLPNHNLSKLTIREWEVLIHIADGLTASEIAKKLCIEIKSAENYRARIASKLNMKGRNVLVRFAWLQRDVLRHWYLIFTNQTPPIL